jgi:hypothetical protein
VGGVLAFVSLEGKGWLDLLPEGGVGKGVLKFAPVLAEKKWEILSMNESKVGLEKFF